MAVAILSNMTSGGLTAPVALLDTPFSRPSTRIDIREEFMGGSVAGTIGWSFSAAGTGAAVGVTNTYADAEHSGVVGAAVGTTATGRATFGTANGSGVGVGFPLAGTIEQRWVVALNALNAVGETFFVKVGLTNSPASSVPNATNAVWFAYSVNSLYWQVESYVSGSLARTLTSTSLVEVGAWYTLDMGFESGVATFYVNNTLVGSIPGSELPTYGTVLGQSLRAVKTAGTGVTAAAYADKFFYTRM